MNTTTVGRMGEQIACKHLQTNGYEIVERNYRAARGEIDIIAKKGMHLAFVEVKTRRNYDFGYAAEAVSFKKQQRIVSAARAFLMSYKAYEDISFDVCEVYTKDRSINYIENAFYA